MSTRANMRTDDRAADRAAEKADPRAKVRSVTTAAWYEAADEPHLVEFGEVRALAVSGQGEPGGSEYGTAVQALYAVLGAAGLPPTVLEGRWWVEDE